MTDLQRKLLLANLIKQAEADRLRKQASLSNFISSLFRGNPTAVNYGSLISRPITKAQLSNPNDVIKALQRIRKSPDLWSNYKSYDPGKIRKFRSQAEPSISPATLGTVFPNQEY